MNPWQRFKKGGKLLLSGKATTADWERAVQKTRDDIKRTAEVFKLTGNVAAAPAATLPGVTDPVSDALVESSSHVTESAKEIVLNITGAAGDVAKGTLKDLWMPALVVGGVVVGAFLLKGLVLKDAGRIAS